MATIQSLELAIGKALDLIEEGACVEGEHHKAWYFDQVVRALHGSDEHGYRVWVEAYNLGAEVHGCAPWDEGIAP